MTTSTASGVAILDLHNIIFFSLQAGESLPSTLLYLFFYFLACEMQTTTNYTKNLRQLTNTGMYAKRGLKAILLGGELVHCHTDITALQLQLVSIIVQLIIKQNS